MRSTIWSRVPPTFAVLALLAGVSLAAAQTGQRPRVGDVQNLTVITLSLDVGSTGKESKRVTYTPPPGWYVRSHAVHCQRKAGYSSFTVNTVPRDWDFVSEEQVGESYRALLNLAAKAHNYALESKLVREQDLTIKELRKGKSSHHALVVEAVARGEGFLRGPGSVQLTVSAELVYVGTHERLVKAVADARKAAK